MGQGLRTLLALAVLEHLHGSKGGAAGDNLMAEAALVFTLLGVLELVVVLAVVVYMNGVVSKLVKAVREGEVTYRTNPW
jgi:uncharacterized membrane protein YqjE